MPGRVHTAASLAQLSYRQEAPINSMISLKEITRLVFADFQDPPKKGQLTFKIVVIHP
jgi:hypothetical protein